MRKFLILLVLAFVFDVAFAQQNHHLKLLSPAEYEEAINQDSVQFVDVRTSEEFSEGHIEGAENVDFLSDEFLLNMGKYKKSQPLYIYCRSGKRSAKAAAQLAALGFKSVIDLEGGYVAWKEFEEK